MTFNRLADETSPYLLQHKDNPVHWRPWGDEAFAEARDSGKPILLSVGYAACHWCHVMAHESFEDPDTAELMNDLFVNIKLDREERPDVDKIYMEALHHLGEQGGWPLTMFLNAERQPFWGGTYFPKEAQYGRPSFRDVLVRISSIYRDAPDKVRTNAEALQDALNRQPRIVAEASAPDLSMEIVDRVAVQIHGIVDPERGGLRGAPKFPQVPIFQLLWRHHLRTGDAASRDLTLVTLENICQGGIYDHLGGGFARYSVDSRWLAPHFEKMLYDNAQLVDLLTLVWQETRDDLFRDRIEETIGWIEREMLAEHSAFAASLDADSDGEEGAFYVWTMAEIEAVLGPDSQRFADVYDATPSGNWEGRIILNRLGSMTALDPSLDEAMREARGKLLNVRAERTRPARDDKILTDWNGLAIAAIANGGLVFGNAGWIELARAAYAGVKANLYRDGRFFQSHRAGRTLHAATADGYANMIRAGLSLLEATNEPSYLEDARLWTDDLDERFRHPENGGFHYTGADATDLIRRTYTAGDDATPNANATMLSNLSRLHAITGERRYRELGERTALAFTPQILASGVAHAGILNGFEDFDELTQIVLVGDPNDENHAALKTALLGPAIAGRQLTCIAPGAKLPSNHPVREMSADRSATAYICKGRTCSLPITKEEQIGDALRRFRP